ncbi:phage tail sheath C-terminal domain-containing protein [uncultured Algoriphagus sp.]|uniref:phage tail sheath family protein n=1 Tax=uncultured Algoriphagus sp. TaxID=417365 RepID=UPI0030EC5870|tara:strand:+ start:22562 stop:23956 length:1395 start_codon:yes stop_codon:yes gene_type:complete
MSQINESAIKTPGVYINEIPLFPPSVAQVETAIPAFIGYTQIAVNEIGEPLTQVPTKIYSLKEYETYFGKAESEEGISLTIIRETLAADATITDPSEFTMYYNLRMYFINGGGPCYIISIGSTTDTPDSEDYDNGLLACEAEDEPTIIVFPDAINTLDEGDYYTLMSSAIDLCAKLQDRFTLVDVHTPGTNNTTTISGFRTAFTKNDNLNYAAVYYPSLKTTFDFEYSEADVDVVINTGGVDAAAVTLASLRSSETAIYNACLAKIREKLSPTLPPSSAMAGVYAKVDASRGVWKAPANVSLNAVYDLTAKISEAEQGGMNIDPTTGKSVNAIRMFQGKGYLVWGARTLAGNDNEWRYVNVRRFFIMVEESSKKATMQFVFEPNDANTWVKLRAMLENYLTLLWRQGALAGAKPEHAFYVRCGLGQTMTAQDILEGRLIVEIGMAAVRPAEFIILRFSHKMQES